jgi:hypothetical protein
MTSSKESLEESLSQRNYLATKPYQSSLQQRYIYGRKGLYNLLKRSLHPPRALGRQLRTPGSPGLHNTHTQSAVWGVNYAHPDHRGVTIRTPKAQSGSHKFFAVCRYILLLNQSYTSASNSLNCCYKSKSAFLVNRELAPPGRHNTHTQSTVWGVTNFLQYAYIFYY